MAGEMVQVVQLCFVCKHEIGTFEVKKENMMLTSKALVRCPNCQAERPELREVAGRKAAMEKEVASLPK